MNLFEIGQYQHAPAAFADYDPRAPRIAQLLAQAIENREPRLVVEHIGSTAVLGCRGKGVVDLAVTYVEDNLEPAKAALDSLGLQRQAGREPWPETRPMRVATVSALGGSFQFHAHVIERNGPEHRELVAFRDALRRDTELRIAYEQIKQQIIAGGFTDSVDYSSAKHAFITATLSHLSNP